MELSNVEEELVTDLKQWCSTNPESLEDQRLDYLLLPSKTPNSVSKLVIYNNDYVFTVTRSSRFGLILDKTREFKSFRCYDLFTNRIIHLSVNNLKFNQKSSEEFKLASHMTFIDDDRFALCLLNDEESISLLCLIEFDPMNNVMKIQSAIQLFQSVNESDHAVLGWFLVNQENGRQISGPHLCFFARNYRDRKLAISLLSCSVNNEVSIVREHSFCQF